MNCTATGVNLSFDKDNRLSSTLSRVSKADTNKRMVLAALLLNNDFKKYLLDNITISDVLNGEIVDFDNFTENDYYKINQNKLGALLDSYYKDNFHVIDNSTTDKGNGKLSGFRTASAKTVARNYTATILVDEYAKDAKKPKNERRKTIEIVAAVNNKILGTFYDRATAFATQVKNDNSFSKEDKALAKKYLDAVAELDSFNSDIRSKQQWYRAYKSQQEEIAKRLKEIKTAIENNKENTNNAELKREYKSLAEQYAKLKKATEDITKEYNDKKLSYPLLKIAKYAYAQQFITTVADRNTVQHGERLLNYANLVMQTRTNANEWYFSIFNTKTMTSIAKVFNQVGDITEFITEEDNNFDEITSEYDGRSIDETARTWEDALAKNFTQNVDNDLKIILSTIPKLDNRYNTRESVQSIDTNNELGVPTYMPVSYVITQIFSFCDTSNIDSFISSIENKANSITALYGLGKIVQMMKTDRVFANRMFANFAKPIFKKVILTVSDITDSNGLSFDWSNKATTPTTQLIYSFSNKLRATYNTSYSTADITTINNAINSFIKNHDKNALKNVLYETIKKYLPNINKDAFSKYFERTTDDTACEAFARDIRSIIEGVGKLKTEINRRIDIINNTNETNYAEYKKALKEYNALDEASKKTAKQPVPKEKQYFDYSSVDFSSATYSSLISLAKRLTEFSDSSAMLNSSNAEGNSTSSVGKNCFISRFFERINSSTEEDVNAGLRAMLEEFTQGTENGKENQYSNNPILFGLKDINGMPVRGCEGIFIKTATGYDINPNAKQLISYYLFDGSKSTTNGKASGYAKLSKLDYFITQYVAFGRSVEEIINDIKSTKVGNLNTAVYSTRIGSDAPKIFNVRAPRYTNSQLRLCLYNHVMDEINMMAKGLNGLFVSAGDNLFNVKENLHGLPAVAFYGKEVAKNGKLTGTLFNPNRLFELDSYDAGKEILSVLSLYGEGDQEDAIRIGQDGKLILKPNQTIVNNGQELEIKLSNEQKAAILNIVDKWINAYLQEASNKLDYFKNVFINNGIEYDQATINNMLLNQVNMNIIYDDIFEGDYKFYGKARTFLKRTKETQAGGDGYAGYDINKYEHNDVHELESNGVKETITIPLSKELNEDGSNKQVPITINGRRLVARNGWRGVTIYNTVKASDYAAQLQQELEKIFIAQGMNEQVAHEKSVKYAQGYGYSAGTVKGSTTVINDAQSYITFEEFIRRRYADGTINEYADLIELLNGDTPIEDIDFDAINKRIQVQKNFYYDKVFDAETGLYMPRQIKNAEFVLIPKLLPEGSELRRVHDWMMKHDIGQLNTEETSKAAKKTVFTIWDEATGDFHEDFEDKFDDSYIENYQYQYLYKQQEVPQHMIDEHNKAGIQIMKKIIDNIIDTTDINNPEREQLVAWANDFQSAYTANIKEDFNSFLDAMGWKYDTDTGHIINASNDSTELNFDDFYNRARQEAARLGMDSNFIEYLMPNEFGVPVMPNYITTVANKLESIAQSIYNNRITRQTLPGWHGAQITSVGYSKKLKFDPVTGVMEVYLPRWSNLIPKGKTEEENAKILEQIQKEGLDIHLAYRMPTEGKQSISVIRVVGFTNEALGSTIVVPNEWVIQTGSDFDVDSIYGISWEMYKTTDKEGNVALHKIPFEENTTTNEERYINYVNNTINNRVRHDDIGNEIENSIKEVKDRLNYVNERNELNEEFNDINNKRNKLYSFLPGWAKSIIKTVNTEFRKSVDGKLITDIRIAYPEINTRLAKYINDNTVANDVLEVVNEYMDYQTATIDVINAQEGIPAFDLDAYRSAKSEAIQQVINDAKQAYLRKVEKAAKEVVLEDFETFTKRPFVEQLSKRARNNFILDRMIKIMNSTNSREEQYGRSNFEKITNGDGTGANDIIDKLYGESSRKRSPYNPLDQTDYQEDVMGGARLKALSVMWDNFCSKNNKIRAILKEDLGIEVILENNIEDSQIEYNFDEIEKSYNDAISGYNSPTKIKFTARRIGFSNNNRNVVGELITTYSSQTTAHHLDAVKMGSVPNVNEYTLNTYKLLSTLGIDYETIISFIRQPAVTRIVNNNNLINSIFLNSKSNPIKMSINQIAVELKLAIDAKHNVTEETRLVDTIEAIKANASIVDAFNTLFGIDISLMEAQDILNIRLPLDKRAYFDRIRQYANKQGDVYEQAAFDLGVIFTFNSIRKIADKVNRYIRVTNADKFGAPVSMRETRQMINDVNKLRTDDTFDKDDVGFIDLIYPEKEGYSGIIDVDKSEYPSIAAIYNYATINSYDTNKQIFITEREEFADAENFVQKALRHKFTENEYKSYKRYIISSLYSQIPVLLSPITLDKRGNLIMVQQDENQSNNEGINANQFWNSERSRIYGYGIATNGDFQIANVNKPTAKEIERFRNLTPAQKVLFIQTHFNDNAGIFNYLNITLFNPADVKYKGINRQYISYNDQVSDIEDLYYLFDKAFFNKNPLIKLAAIDLVKYAFIAEGFNFKTGYISKIIPNDVLYTNINEGGTGVIRSVESLIYGLAEQIQTEDFVTDFARSHSDMIDIQRMPALPEQTIDKYTGLQTYKYHNITTILRGLTRPDGLIHIDATVDNKLLTNLIAKLNLKDNNSNYIRINTPIDNNRRTTNLYKIQATNPIYDNNGIVAGYQDYFLIPLNILDSTENFEYSYNEYNNTHNSYQYYMSIVTQISDIANNARQTKVDSKVLRHTINKAVPSVKAPVGKYTGETQDIHTNTNLLSELVTTSDEFLRGGVEKLVNSIINHAENTEEGFNEPLVEFIPNTALRQILGRGDKANQTFELNNGSTITVTIEHQTVTKRMIDGLTEMMNSKRDAKEYATAVKQMKDSKTLPAYADLYRITRAKESKETLDKQALNAATELIIDEAEVDESTGQTPRRGTRLDIDGVSRQIINEIRYDARKNKDAAAERFVKEIDRRRVNPYLESSRRTNRGNIYRAAARYYQTAANSLINALDGFEIAGEIYSFDDAHMYEALAEHDEYFSEVAKIILDGITFGNRIADILNLDLSAEDIETKTAIESIIHNINAVKTNKKLVAALDNIINIYFKKYSTNPLIAEDILKLRETFGDLDAIDFWVGDPFDIDNNEVQTILKQVYSTFAKAEMFDTRRNVKEWKDKLAEIEAMQESLDMDKIIDTKHGRIRQDYNEDFIKEKNRLLDELNEAKAHKNDSIEAFNRYIDAKYAKYRFYQQHFEQRIVDDYYKEELDAREKAMRIPGKYYYTYVRLVDELYNTSNSTSLSAEELSARKKQIIEKLNILKNDNTNEARALNEYISKKKELQEKYFTSKEYEGFTEIYKRYDRYIKKYDAANITKTLEEKLQDVGYREAYNWIRENGNLRFVGEEAIKLNKAFIAIRGTIDSVPKQIVKQIKTISGAVDDNGIINPMMLSDEQIKQLHDAEEKEFEDYYGDPLGDGVLIKINPSNLPIFDKSKATTAKEKDEITYAQYRDNRLKKQLIAKINATLYKVIDRNTGKIIFEDLFNDDIVSNDERDELIRNYNELRALSNNPFKKFKKIKGEAYTEEIYEAGYYEALNYYNLHLKNTRQGIQWIKLFTEKDAAGDIHPNRLIFGFKKWDDKFVNTEKTEAVKYIHDNVEFVHTEYYDRTSREAAAKGPEYYKDWFRKNHVYNPYSHTWTPLRIWSTISAKPGTALANAYQYIPTGDNLERSVKDDYVNLNYSEFGSNYKKGDSRYDNPIVLNDKEKAYKKLLIQTLNKYATTYSGKRFVGQGFLPRERKTDIDSRWAATNALGMFGVSYKSATASDDFYDNVDYSHDREAEMKMLQLIKDKGSQKLKKLPLRQSFNNEIEYQKELAKVKKENEAIQKQNEAIDSANLNTDWNNIMERFIHNATIFNSRQNAKPYLYLLLEDLVNNNAYMIKGMWNKRVVKDSFSSSDDRAEYKTVKQERTYNLVQNLARRMLYSQHHEQGTARNVANFMQNMASAKYMITNLYGGIANVTTGATNIAMESAAGEYFGHGDLASAESDYWTAVPDIVKNLYSDKADNLTNAFIKLFNVVEFDQIIQYGDGGNEMSEYVKRARNALYGFQSAGEHIMQNTVMLAMFKSNRLYTDANGVRRIGDFKDFAQGIEKLAMQKTLEDYPQLKVFYDTFRKTLKFDTAKKLDIDSGRKDINRMFLNSLKYSNDEATKALYRKIATEYAKNRNELMNTEKTKFLEAKTVESLFELKDGQAVLKEKVIAEFNAEGINRIGDLEQLVGGFKRKVEAVNKKIHGIYDKISAGYLESKWYGSIVMQYHKHLYMGIMKRWRRKGYYSEIKGSRERGVYQDIIDFLSMEFEGIGDRINQQVQNGDNIALASIQNVIGTTIETIANIQFNWNTLSNAEKANCKRQLGELGGILASMLIAMVLFGGWDDDEIKDSGMLSSCLYLADRLYSETSMYTPWGLVSEAKTAWSSPIASTGEATDLLKACQLLTQALADPDFDATYKTGQYAGKNKFRVLLRRNMPGVRPYDRIMNITRNNQYYKIGESQIGMNIAKTFGESLRGE